MRYASVCDGIGAAHAAWIPLGWQCAWVSEIEPFPIAVVEERVPGLLNLGDMNAITQEMLDAHGRIDALVGGTPCQSFSVAGLRGGLADARGNLALRFVQLVGALRPAWVVWENVPGVLSSSGGRDFGAILGALAELGYGWAYRVLDAQYFGVPQRRRRVFVVASSRDWRRAAAVLFEREGMRGDPPTRRATGACVARSLTSSTGGASAKEQQHTFVGGDGKPLNALRASWWDGSQLSPTIDARIDQHRMPDKGRFSAVLEPFVKAKRAQSASDDETWKADGVSPSHHAQIFIAEQAIAFDWQKGNDVNNPRPSTMNVAVEHSQTIGTTRTPAVAFKASHYTRGRDGAPSHVTPPLSADADKGLRNCVQQGVDLYNQAVTGDCHPPLRTAGGHGSPALMEHMDAQTMAVRRLTPLECERLQGFPDGWTQIPWRKKPAEECPDGPRYRALGNSMAVPVMRWIGERIAAVEAIR